MNDRRGTRKSLACGLLSIPIMSRYHHHVISPRDESICAPTLRY
jgi:hypothetical protein